MADNEDNGIVDLRKRVEQRIQEEKAKKQAKEVVEDTAEEARRVYEVALKSGEKFQVEGVLILSGAFFALGMPIGDTGAVDFNWASPLENVEYVLALEPTDLEDNDD